MFPQQPQQQFRTTNANVQTFYKDSAWSKPPGVSHVYMMLIGGGGGGDATSGGGSGAVTTWYGAAQHVPDSLVVTVSTGDSVNTVVRYRSASAVVALLTANGAIFSAGGTAMTANQFTASGFFQSVAGQAGSSGSITPSSTTFLSGGAQSSVTSVTANYGYTVSASGTDLNGYFQLQPIIVGTGAKHLSFRAGIGCGVGYLGVGSSPGLVLIASW